MNREEELKSFILFMDQNKDEDMRYIGACGIIETKGCSGDFGGCCSKQHDLQSLYESFKEVFLSKG